MFILNLCTELIYLSTRCKAKLRDINFIGKVINNIINSDITEK